MLFKKLGFFLYADSAITGVGTNFYHFCVTNDTQEDFYMTEELLIAHRELNMNIISTSEWFR